MSSPMNMKPETRPGAETSKPSDEAAFAQSLSTREMYMTTLSLPTIARRELEEHWRHQLKMAYERYQTAINRYKALQQLVSVAGIDDCLLAEARHEKSQAQTEYERLLKIFADLAVEGRMPQGRADSSAEWARD